MKKKGFTLIELLAVIAILAILLILTIPNIIKMFNNAKKRAFITESQSIINTAEKQYMADQLNGNTQSTYYCYDGSGENENKLSLTGNATLKYYIKILNGKVTTVNVESDKYTTHVDGEKIDASSLKTENVIALGDSGTAPVTSEGGNDRVIVPLASSDCYVYSVKNNEVTIIDYYETEKKQEEWNYMFKRNNNFRYPWRLSSGGN